MNQIKNNLQIRKSYFYTKIQNGLVLKQRTGSATNTAYTEKDDILVSLHSVVLLKRTHA
jgi:hypothetical protein